ncbi:hypothetical protein [Paraburkholderia guartelaensis]|uniref:hypothetical protein n=1 Tax=Paraburkholderia guartelaensis TaxID=2546446 RepID=UPI002AB72CA2|nr:hypothetical protein [Paraburkholderia guartelaensis]
MSLSKSVILLLLTILSNYASAGNLIIFDDPGVVAYESGGRVSGFYREDDDRRSCYFLFYQDDEKSSNELMDGYSRQKINTFGLNYEENRFAFDDRPGNSDISGYIYKKDSAWVISTDEEPGGCGFEVGGFMHLPQDQSTNTYTAKKSIPAIGVRVVNKKTYFYDKSGEDFARRSGYLTPGDAVVILQQNGAFSFVRFSDPRSDKATYGKLTTGWMRSIDLVNPFPLAIK